MYDRISFMRYWKDLAALALIIIIIGIFFLRLFFPFLSLFATPDFGQSDIWQLNLPLKFYLSDSLKNGHWPLWNPYIGNGFPSLAEGQIGTFNFSNLLLFRFLPFVYAFNFSYIFIFFTVSLGTYFYCQTLKITKLSSFMAALLFSFSGTFITHISHINLIQTASYLPWLFLSIHNLIYKKNKLMWGVLFSLVLSQQIFSGFPQLVVISLIGVSTYLIFHLTKLNIKKKFPIIIIFIIFLLLGILASSGQLLPQYEFLRLSDRANGLDSSTSTLFSYPFKHLITFIFPFKLGDPRIGTYPHFVINDGSIFWENTGYIGIIPLFFVILSLVFFRKNKNITYFWLLLFMSFLMMTGKYSPLYFIYSFPPFSYFRVPSRFIFLFVWALVILSGYGLDFITVLFSKIAPNLKLAKYFNSIKLFVILLSSSQLLSFSYTYNALLPASAVLKPPSITSYIKKDNIQTIYSFGSSGDWNRIFLTRGWRNINDYLFLKNALVADINILYGISSFNSYRAQLTRRYNIIQNALDDIQIDPYTQIASVSSQTENLMQLNGINYIITPSIIINGDFTEIKSIKNSTSTSEINLYQLNNSRNGIYVTDNFENITYLPDFFQNISDKLPDMGTNLIFLEKNIKTDSDNTKLDYRITKFEKYPSGKNMEIVSNKAAVIVISQSYYPGWRALVNGKEEKILPVNINQIGLPIEKGISKVNLFYRPSMFKYGIIITVISYLTLITIALLQIFRFHFK